MNKRDQGRLSRVPAECPGYQSRAAARALTRYYNSWFAPLGLTAEQFSLLIGIEAGAQPTAAYLAAASGLDATTLSRNVQKLEIRRLVHAEGRGGRGGKRLSLTRSGHATLDKAVSRWTAAQRALSHRIGKDQVRATIRLMTALAAAARLTVPTGADRR